MAPCDLTEMPALPPMAGTWGCDHNFPNGQNVGYGGGVGKTSRPKSVVLTVENELLVRFNAASMIENAAFDQ
jgi:hypothetical protein